MFKGPQHPMHRRKKLFLLPAIALLLFGLGAIIQRLWNAILPDVAHVSAISYWQAMGLLLLCRILFGRFHFGGRGHDGRRFGMQPHEMREKWRNMSDEERALFKQRFKDRCRNR